MDLSSSSSSSHHHSSALSLALACPSSSSYDTEPHVTLQEFRIMGQPMCVKRPETTPYWGNRPLKTADPEIFSIMEEEKDRQRNGIELIASENFVCRAVMEALGSHLTNKYSEGLLLPGDRIMGLDTPSGGNTSHGYYLPNGRKVSAASIFFESLMYKVNPQTGYIDYDKLEERALEYRPNILICGGSSYPREWDYARFRQVADKCGAVLMCDMAQISGLVAAKECVSPFNYCDIVTSTTHKSLRGPRGGIIFYRRGIKPRKRGILLNQGVESDRYDLEDKINFAVFPSLQGGPHNNHIAALAIALKQVASPEYKAYMQQVKKNAQSLANALLRRNCRLVTGGTDNHLLLWDIRPLGLTGKYYEKVCELCHITLNKVAIFGDNGAITPGGVRIGTPAMTSRGCLESDFETMADFLLRAAHIAIMVQREHGKLQKGLLESLHSNTDILELQTQVEAFATQFAMPGFDI
ncbi:serine hydroxymethyltransferase 7-like isoform X2 [Mangifera indica]|uniref:serine hydroxymethyltransferase 7-like isoform X2 n=1 Tax=Mangifera indica TaxID=29780 RepID=UPI001CF9BD59|nr:serine hydroxymethyltransferase 7-like isoform X2 [Mangifera indica]